MELRTKLVPEEDPAHMDNERSISSEYHEHGQDSVLKVFPLSKFVQGLKQLNKRIRKGSYLLKPSWNSKATAVDTKRLNVEGVLKV